MPSVWRQVAAALIIIIAGLTAYVMVDDEQPAEAYSNCWTSSTSYSFTVNCYQGRHQAHVKCRRGLFGVPYNVHGPSIYGYGASTAGCGIGVKKIGQWATLP